MWTQASLKSRNFRNAVTLLEAGGYVVDVGADRIRVRTRRAGREWECGSAEEFFDACAFHCWEAFDGDAGADLRNPAAPETRSAADWTLRIHEDPQLRLGVRRFYEKGYAIRISRGVISYVDRRGANHEFRSEGEFLAGLRRLGREGLAATTPRRPTAADQRHVEELQARMLAAEARAARAEARVAVLVRQAERDQRLRDLITAELDPQYTKATGLEKIVRAEVFRLLSAGLAEPA